MKIFQQVARQIYTLIFLYNINHKLRILHMFVFINFDILIFI